jgi:hypothetical protein
MKSFMLLIAVGAIFPSPLLAQRDAPVWDCYLPSIKVAEPHRDADLRVELTFCKGGGPTEHKQHQMYLLCYVAEDEDLILEISKDISLLDKKAEGKTQQFLDVLLENKLIAIADTKTASQYELPDSAYDSNRELTDEELEKSGTFDFKFKFSKPELLEKAKQLKNFRPDRFDPNGGYFEDRLKFIVFVPVNDSKYATDVPEDARGEYDFAGFDVHRDPKIEGDFFSHRTPILYFRPLPYEFELRKLLDGDEAGRLLLYIH